ncbi:MAG: hypothetical protein GY742_15360 [Hyphomicrobiales bacterium]|nr:hypothetical protein [Hyphomicrobiales bacterium]
MLDWKVLYPTGFKGLSDLSIGVIGRLVLCGGLDDQNYGGMPPGKFENWLLMGQNGPCPALQVLPDIPYRVAVCTLADELF